MLLFKNVTDRLSAGASKFCVSQFFLVNYNCDASYDHLWCPNGVEVTGNGPEVGQKWTGSVLLFVSTSLHPKHFPYLLDEPYAPYARERRENEISLYFRLG